MDGGAGQGYWLVKEKESRAQRVDEEWGSLTWLASHELTTSSVTVGRVVIRPGRENPRHCHDNCEEVLHLVRGTLRHSVGAETLTMAQGDTLIVPAGTMHNALNPGVEDADMIVAYSTGRRGFRKEA